MSARSRAARRPLPAVVVLLGVLGGCAIVLPLLGLGTRVVWTQLPALLASQPARLALWLSLRTCALATVICVLLGVPLALLLSRQWPGVRVARILAVLPMTMPPVVAGVALLSTLGKRGALGPFLEAVGLRISFTTTAVVIAQVFVAMPYLVVTLEAALRSQDHRTETIARTLGARPWTVLTRITLPLVGPALARGTALALGRSLGEFGATIAFAGSKEGVTRTMPLAIYLERENDTATSLALAVVLVALSFAVVGATTIPWRGLDSLRHRSPLPADRATGHSGGDHGPEPPPSDPGDGPHPRPALQDAPARGERGQELSVGFTLEDRDVSVALTVAAGRTVALVGPNGSGKSTVCEVVAGLLDAVGGEVRVGDRSVDGPQAFTPVGQRGVALLSQDPCVFTHMSVLDNVGFGPRCRGEGRRSARRLALEELRAVGAAHLAARAGSALSGGQAARVALARALATRPHVLVLDEPTAALDVTARQELRALIARRAQEEGLTVLLVTHDVLDITALADDVVVLERGRIVEEGTAGRVLAAPTSAFAARLAGASVLTGVIARAGGPEPCLRLASGERIVGRPPQHPGDALPVGSPAIALIPPEAVALYPPREEVAGSPRNALRGRVRVLDRAGALVTASIDLGGGQTVSSTVTAAAVAELRIEPGQEVVCVVKAVQVHILPRRQVGPPAPQGGSTPGRRGDSAPGAPVTT